MSRRSHPETGLISVRDFIAFKMERNYNHQSGNTKWDGVGMIGATNSHIMSGYGNGIRIPLYSNSDSDSSDQSCVEFWTGPGSKVAIGRRRRQQLLAQWPHRNLIAMCRVSVPIRWHSGPALDVLQLMHLLVPLFSPQPFRYAPHEPRALFLTARGVSWSVLECVSPHGDTRIDWEGTGIKKYFPDTKV